MLCRLWDKGEGETENERDREREKEGEREMKRRMAEKKSWCREKERGQELQPVPR